MNDNTMDFSQTMLELTQALNELSTRDDEEACCSFCGKPQSAVNLLVPGPNSVYICDLCVDRAVKLIGQRS